MVKSKGAKAKKAKKPKDGEAIDAETALQVKEVEERLQALTVEMKQLEGKMKHCALEAKRAELTEKELKPLPEDLKVYRQVGKMFIQQPKPDLARSLKAQVAVKTLEGQQLRQTLGKIQEKVKSEAKGLQELIGPERMKQLFQGETTADQSAGAPAPDANAMMPIFGKEKPAQEPAEGEQAPQKDPEAKPAPTAVEV
ncbi:unnamed protein product [Durusdinium trenchii]|uniref:Uncharacterized protein n=2 Tax=Durusdinium trenchii TaxID=1381693 RepID=A0ABP0R3B5_9DINO